TQLVDATVIVMRCDTVLERQKLQLPCCYFRSEILVQRFFIRHAPNLSQVEAPRKSGTVHSHACYVACERIRADSKRACVVECELVPNNPTPSISNNTYYCHILC